MDTVECPVCSGTFSVANIVIHASTCGIGANNVSNMNGKKRKLSSVEEDSQPATSSGNGKSFSIFSQTKKTKTNDATSTGIKTREPESHQAKGSDPEVGKKRKLDIPLAERMRPTDFSLFRGQDAAVGPKSQLRPLLESDNIPSMILWGPPGCGKTSLVNVIAARNKISSSARLVKMSACTAGVADVREVIKQAKNEIAMFKRRTILFLDEVHRSRANVSSLDRPPNYGTIVQLI